MRSGYLQDMIRLEIINPDRMFDTGKFVIRRSDRFWAGLSKDLVIEQTLMRSMKSVGSLIHGRGIMDDQSRTKWLLSLPLCAKVNEAMQNFTGKE